MKLQTLSIGLCLSAILSVSSFNLWKPRSIDGSWKIVKVENINNDGTKSSIFPKQSHVILLVNYIVSVGQVMIQVVFHGL